VRRDGFDRIEPFPGTLRRMHNAATWRRSDGLRSTSTADEICVRVSPIEADGIRGLGGT